MDEQNTQLQQEEDEISLIDLFAVLLHYKKMIIIISVLAAVFSVIFAIISIVMAPEKSPMPNVYTPKAEMLIKENSSSNGLSSMLSSSGLGSLASLAGVSVGGGGSSNTSLATYLISSDALLDAVTDEFKLIEKFKIEKSVRASSRKMLKQVLKATSDTETGVFTVSFTDIDPIFAQSVVNYVVDWMSAKFDELGLDNNKIQKENLERNIKSSYNEILSIEQEIKKLGASVGYAGNAWNIPSITTGSAKLQLELEAQKQVYTQLKTQYELLKVQMQSETPVFQILARPEIPDLKSGPSRGKMCIIVTFAAFFMSVFLAFALNAWKNIKNDPEAVEKLQLNAKKSKETEESK
ncbi:MAG: lipopolysaccharide biosynthesis protein [Treponema sp.]|nr:lipopolysaccharide biosynthesis protein [Treponema sp.]